MGSPSVNIEEDLTPESSLVDNLINLLSFEIHAPGYHFCGPGTRLNERLEKCEKGVNPLDAYCREHDIAYATVVIVAKLIVCWPNVSLRVCCLKQLQPTRELWLW